MLTFQQFVESIKWVPGQKDWKSVTGQHHTYSVEHRPISWLKTTDRTIPSREKKVMDKVKAGSDMDMIVAGVDGTIHDGHHRRKMALKYHDKNDTIPVQIHRLKEDLDLKKLKKAVNHNDAYHILDSHEGTRGGTPAAGGCGVLAHALHKHLPGSKLVDIHNKTSGGTEHVGVHHGNHVYDAYGAHPVKHFVSRFQKREGVHGELEMTPHDPKRTAQSEISTHPATVAKMHDHLKKHLQ